MSAVKLAIALLLFAAAACGSSTAPDAKPGTIDARLDAQTSCAPSGGCPQGPACGTTCCQSGEACVSGACMCATNTACAIGDTCAAAGAQRPDMCGSICCGASGPCPGVTGP